MQKNRKNKSFCIVLQKLCLYLTTTGFDLRNTFNNLLDVAIGKLDQMEIDFIATSYKEKIYIQVTDILHSENIEREIAPLQKIQDNHPKVILAYQTTYSDSINGIAIQNLLPWLLND